MGGLFDQVASTIAVPDRVIRNLRITQTYHRILLAMRRLTGATDVTWPAYAVWASRSVGYYIRAEVIPNFADDFVREVGLIARMVDEANHDSELLSLVSLPATFIHEAIAQVTETIPVALGEGNRLVFEELGPAYVSFLETFHDRPQGDPQRLQHYLAGLRPGRPEDDGQSMLSEAFEAYHAAMGEPDPKRHAEWMLLANLRTGYHEQIRLQGTIANALDVGLADAVIRRLDTADCGLSAHLSRLIIKAAPKVFAEVEELWRAAATELFMTLDFPDVKMRIGEDVPPLPSGRPFPIDLTQVDNPGLLQVLAELDRSPNSLRRSSAHDWSVLSDRMNFIVDVFRSRQQHPPLFFAPFTDAQTADIDRNTLPHSDLL